MTKVIICGGGIGGLSAAHELIRSGKEYEIHIYERNNDIGGQARSIGDNSRNFSEYCWHVVGRGYTYLTSILQEIPLLNSSSSVFDQLTPMNRFIYARYPENGDVIYDRLGDSFLSSASPSEFIRGIYNCGGALSAYDYFLMTKIYMISQYAPQSVIDSYSDMLWSEFCSGASEEFKKWAVDSPSIYLGMYTSKLSTRLILDLFRNKKTVPSDVMPNDFYSFNGPINKVWFEPWREYLESKGVVFHMNTNIERFHFDRSHSIVAAIELENGDNIRGDFFVNAMSVEGLASAFGENGYFYKTIGYNRLRDNGRQIQSHILYKIPNKLDIKESTIIVLPDTEWCIMIRVEGGIWDDTLYEMDGDLLSAGIGIWDRKGRNGKCAQECTREEIANEVWNQIVHHHRLNDLYFSDIETTPEWDIWSSYVFSNGMIDTYEPKFSNNVHTLEYRPEITDDFYKNLYHATAYARTETNIFCMESAAEAGVKVGMMINNEEQPEEKVIKSYIASGIELIISLIW